MDFIDWSECVFASVQALSRTAGGATAPAYQNAKPSLLVTDQDALRQQTATNLRRAIAHVWTSGTVLAADNPTSVTSFMHSIAERISDGLLPQGVLLRTWDTREKYPEQIVPTAIPQAIRALTNELSQRLMSSQEPPVKLAAWLEREIDRYVHPYADGCGRTAKLMGAFVLLRHNLPPAHFTDRASYYTAMNGTDEGWLAYYESHILPFQNKRPA